MDRFIYLAPDLVIQSVYTRAFIFVLLVTISFGGLVFFVSKTLVDPYCRHFPQTFHESRLDSDRSSSGPSPKFSYPTFQASQRYLRRDSFCDAR